MAWRCTSGRVPISRPRVAIPNVSRGSASQRIFSRRSAYARLGRLPAETEYSIDADPVVVLSHGFWQSRFGADPAVVGSTIRLSGVENTVVGVLAHEGDIFEVAFFAPIRPSAEVLVLYRDRDNFAFGSIGAGLMLRSLREVMAVDPGFETDNLLTFLVALPSSRYSQRENVLSLHDALRVRLAEIPGVVRVAQASQLPLGASAAGYLTRAFLPEGGAEPPAGDEVLGPWEIVTPGYFTVMGQPMRFGREFTATDSYESTPVMIVNREFARRMFGDERSAIGKRVRSWRDENLYRQIVGVVDDVRYFGAGDEIRPVAYIPLRQDSRRALMVVMRVERDPASLLTTFAALAVLLAAVGIYGVLSVAVAQRTREFGVRMALGAGAGNVRGMVLREAVSLIGLGGLLGIVTAGLASRVLSAVLFGVTPTDPMTFVAVLGVLLALGLLASRLPALRATRVDPVQAMRAE